MHARPIFSDYKTSRLSPTIITPCTRPERIAPGMKIGFTEPPRIAERNKNPLKGK